jgi:hypothetical protein
MLGMYNSVRKPKFFNIAYSRNPKLAVFKRNKLLNKMRYLSPDFLVVLLNILQFWLHDDDTP